jgi:hypothetical protein
MPTQLRFWNELRQWSLVPASSITGGIIVLPDARWPGGTVGGVAYGAIFYVATNGADVPASAGGGTAAAPWLTPAYAAAQIAGGVFFAGQAVLLQAVTGHAAFTSGLILTPWSGGGTFTFDGGGGSIITTNGASAIIVSGILPGLTTIQNGTLGATGSQFASGLQCAADSVSGLGGGGQIRMSNCTFQGCSFAYVWISGLAGGQPSVFWLDTISLAATAAGQGYAIFSAFPALFVAGFLRTCTVKLTGNVTFAAAVIGAAGGWAITQGGGGAAVSWQLNGHTSTGSNTSVSPPGLTDFTGFH